MPSRSQQSTTPIRLPVDLKEWAKGRAKARGISLNSMIIEMLQRQRENDDRTLA